MTSLARSILNELLQPGTVNAEPRATGSPPPAPTKGAESAATAPVAAAPATSSAAANGVEPRAEVAPEPGAASAPPAEPSAPLAASTPEPAPTPDGPTNLPAAPAAWTARPSLADLTQVGLAAVPKAGSEVAPKGGTEPAPRGDSDVAASASSEAAPKAGPKPAPEVGSGPAPAPAPQVAPEAASKVAPETGSGPAPETAPRAAAHPAPAPAGSSGQPDASGSDGQGQASPGGAGAEAGPQPPQPTPGTPSSVAAGDIPAQSAPAEPRAVRAAEVRADLAHGVSDAPAPRAREEAAVARPEPAPARRIVDTLVSQIHVQLGQTGATEATVRLRPESLGRVEIRLHLEDGHLRAQFAADRPEVRAALRQHLPELERALAGGRGGVNSLSVEVGGTMEDRGRAGFGPAPRRRAASPARAEIVNETSPARALRAPGTGRLDLYA
ncbi:MAG TPA: flagellar hook-length control protein FliK [Candidatus Saccharimonadales bacterium]|nr:flagellar hook-length control protein FliK [Candidatus Saccharimonadales bacterium]